MADLTETVTEIVPGIGVKTIFFTATKAAQNDTITFSSYVTVYGMSIKVGNNVETWTQATNVITLTSANTGAITGIAVVLGG